MAGQWRRIPGRKQATIHTSGTLPLPLQTERSPCIPNGETSIQTLGLSYLTMESCAGILVAYIVICRLVAYLGVRYITW